MPINLKALIVVLVIASAVFALARPILSPYVDSRAYTRRVVIWFVLTIAGFVTPSIWLYALIALPVMFIGAQRDDNPLALYVLLMFVVPANANVPIPTIGIGQLFDANHTRMMALVILVPLLLRRGAPRAADRAPGWTPMDWALLGFGALQLALLMPYESPTNTLRRAVLFFLDTFVVFYVFARIRPTREALVDVIATFVLMCVVMAPIAVFETVRGWLLYDHIQDNWGSKNLFAFLLRGDSLRAQVATGHALVLGYILALSIGFMQYLHARQPKDMKLRTVSFVLCLGLLATYSRGPWLTALLLVLIYLAVRPGAARYFAKLLPAMILIGVAVYASPLKESVIDRLPIIGSADQSSIDYRRQLAELSWQLIKLHPWLGDPFVMRNMEELRQGQGIIDLVNAYATVTLFYGTIGLALFMGTFAFVLWRCHAAMRLWATQDADMAALGAMLIACMLASLFFIGTAGVGTPEYVLAGLMATYARIALPQAVPTEARPLPAGISYGRYSS